MVFSEDFSASNPFFEGSIVSGRLKVAGQMSRDILAWLQETPDAISFIPASSRKDEGRIYNLSGQRVNRGYRGIVVVKGKKYQSIQY